MPGLGKYLVEGVSNSIPPNELNLFVIPEEDKISEIAKFPDLKMEGGKISYKVSYTGGAVTAEAKELVNISSDINMELTEYNNNILDLKKIIIELQDKIYEFNLLYIQTIFYHFFMVNIVSNNIISQEQMVYNLLSIGGCQYYLNIINVILKKIESKTMSAAERYFQKYHYILLNNFKKLFEFVIEQKNKNNKKDHVFNLMESVIDINASKNRIKYLLVTFNNFKDLLDSYKSSKLPSVSIYARINDWEQNNSSKGGYNNKNIYTRTLDESIFSRNKDDGQILNVNLNNCGNLDRRPGLPPKQANDDFKNDKFRNINNIKVEEVYDTQNFKDNGVISKYMSLPVQLSQKKGTMLITYGYSGVGKTFSLFGNGNLPGLLQTTLLEIRGQESIKFRLFEIYGMGVQYNFYWKDKSKIYQKLFAYNLKKKDNKLDVAGDPTEYSEYSDIKSYIAKTYKKEDASTHSVYTDIEYSSFKSFNEFVGIVDKVRERSGRITETPNNPQSSRSIIVYDFQIVLKDGSVVPFVIVDLPGKENIVQSYIQNDKFKVTGDNTANPAIAASIYLNPIFTPFYKSEFTVKIKEYIEDNFDKLNRQGIIEEWKKKKIYTIKLTRSKDNFIETLTVSDFLDNTEKVKLSGENDKKNNGWNTNIDKRLYIGPNINIESQNEYGDVQRYNNLFFYFINTLIDLGKIDILVDLLTTISEGDIIGSKKEVRNKIRLAYEGVYINENILGMIYTMISMIKNDEGKYKNPSYEIKNQKDISNLSTDNDRLDITNYIKLEDMKEDDIEDFQGKIFLRENAAQINVRSARGINYKIYKDTQDPNINISESLFKANELYSTSVDSYNPEDIYTVNFAEDDLDYDKKQYVEEIKYKSLMGDLLSPYVGESNSIKSIYIFYLLTNNDPDRKCKNQIELLSGAKKFIKALNPIE